jgi:hypothetical protein
MKRLLTPIVLCFAAQMATAQCVNATTAAPATTQMRPAVELIRTAAAGTRDAPMLTQSAATHKGQSGDERHRPAGRAMLLAAVALMSGIALRRASASGQ